MPTLNLVKWLNPENPNAEKQKHKQINLSLKEDAWNSHRRPSWWPGQNKKSHNIENRDFFAYNWNYFINPFVSHHLEIKHNCIRYIDFHLLDR